MHSMYLAGVPLPWSMLRQPIHFAPGAIPIWLITAIVTDRRANGVRAMEEIIARLRRIVPARVAHAVMNGVMPVKIVIRVCSIPAAVVRLERVMCPANAGISSCNNNSLASEIRAPRHQAHAYK